MDIEELGLSKDGADYMRRYYSGNQEIEADFARLARYVPEVLDGYFSLRQAVFRDREGSAIDPKMRELLVLAIEVACRKVNPPPAWHARKAIEAGATPQEVAEVVGLCIMLGGMMTYRESGRFALKAAIDAHEAGVSTSDSIT